MVDVGLRKTDSDQMDMSMLYILFQNKNECIEIPCCNVLGDRQNEKIKRSAEEVSTCSRSQCIHCMKKHVLEHRYNIGRMDVKQRKKKRRKWKSAKIKEKSIGGGGKGNVEKIKCTPQTCTHPGLHTHRLNTGE